MSFPVGGSAANLGSTGTSKFIPQVWSSKLVIKFYDACVYTEIANTDYEGEIKDYGDKVIIRTIPAITVNDYVKGAGLTYEDPESANVELDIDKGKSFSFNLYDIDRYQSDINLMNTWAEDGAEQIKVAVDTDFLATIPAGAAAENSGATAGVKSSSINLGVASTPRAITQANIIEFIVQCGVVMDEQNRPEEGRWLVLPAIGCGLIKSSDLKDASLSGDNKSPLRTGAHGMVDRFNIFKSNNVNVSSGEYDVVFGDKKAITFAGQITKMEDLKNPDDFGDLARSLFVYGFEVIDEKGAGHAVCTFAWS